MDMNWDAIGAIAEVIGAAAVLGSLLYLANQIRQGTEVARSVARQGIAETAIAELSSVVENAELAELLFRKISGEDVEDHEDYRLRLFAFRSFRLYENAHFQYWNGLLQRDEWLAFRSNLSLLFELDFYNHCWEVLRPQFTPIFRQLVEDISQDLEERGRLGAAGAEIIGLGKRESG